jgi:hypothetical protein
MSDERIKINLKVLALLKGGKLNADIIKEYTGWGGLREAIFTPSIYKEIKRYLSDEEIIST